VKLSDYQWHNSGNNVWHPCSFVFAVNRGMLFKTKCGYEVPLSALTDWVPPTKFLCVTCRAVLTREIVEADC
jgi:hypothetical protein